MKGPSAIGGKSKCCVSYLTALAAGAVGSIRVRISVLSSRYYIHHAEYFVVYSRSDIFAVFVQKLNANKRVDIDSSIACANHIQCGLNLRVREVKDSPSPVHRSFSWFSVRSPFSRKGSSSKEIGLYFLAISNNMKTTTHTRC